MAKHPSGHARPIEPGRRSDDGSRPQRQRPLRGHEGRHLQLRRLQQGHRRPEPERVRPIRLVCTAGQRRHTGHRHRHREREEPCCQGRAEGRRSVRCGEHRRRDQHVQQPVRQDRRRCRQHGHVHQRPVLVIVGPCQGSRGHRHPQSRVGRAHRETLQHRLGQPTPGRCLGTTTQHSRVGARRHHGPCQPAH